ncbi:DUF5691 domain-containing protein [Nocardiopsis algeriensis]|uniref:Uncharacterized protein n=1 Tax=Nocardiopsis algeriensis TaxID=1478215 RepID=A0A841IX04_9ACTN|nr:hypothetical protein [Nocardiopsis algeriensis]
MSTPSPAGFSSPADPLEANTSWDKLVSAALVGTSRRPAPPTPDLPPTPADEDAEAGASALLDRAALAVVRRLAGHVPATVAAEAVVAPDGEDDASVAGPEVTRRLERILAGPSELLPEWLGLAGAAGLHVAPSTLPALLAKGAYNSSLRPAIAAVAGPRGRWLARVNPGWGYVNALDPRDRVFDEHTWERGSAVERSHALAALRAVDPDRARELLAAAWPDLGRAELRRHLLEALSTGLGPADEEFVEKALDDKGGNVRGLALSLLVRLPDSAHAHRLRGYVRDLATFPQGLMDGAEVASLGPQALRDLALVPAGDKPGAQVDREHRWALVTNTPLDVWTELTGRDPAGIFRYAEEHEGPLFDALANAITHQGNAEWARALLTVFRDGALGRTNDFARRHPSFPLRALLSLLPVEERCAWVLGSLTEKSSMQDLYDLLAGTAGPWTRELSAEVAGRLRAPKWQRDARAYGPVCEIAAERMPVDGIDDLPPDLPEIRGSYGNAEPSYAALRDTLLFRLDMHREFM